MHFISLRYKHKFVYTMIKLYIHIKIKSNALEDVV